MGRKRKRNDDDTGGNNNNADGEVRYNAQGKVKGKHDKPKPWDTPDIDHWKQEKFDDSVNPTGMLEESSFSTLFPRYREKYLQEAWPIITSELKKYGISGKLNLVEGSMTVATTRKTRDPYIIIKSRDLIRLLARSVPAQQALKVLGDDMASDIIKIGSLIRNKERFVKRRQRLLGPNGATLKALELLTGCYILVQGSTVSVMGPYPGLKTVRRVVESCIGKNEHPIYHIKALMIKRELAKDPLLATEQWDRFLPKFKKRNVKRKVGKKKTKEYTPFPPPPQPSKIDLEIESGQYFLSADQKAAKKAEEKKQKQMEKTMERKRERDAEFVPPKESKRPRLEEPDSKQGKNSDVAEMANSLKEKLKQRETTKPQIDNVERYVA